MSAIVIGDGSGFPKRCFEWVNPKTGLKLKFCVVWLEYPSFEWLRNKPDPGPLDTLEIEGVDRAVLRDLQIVDTITWLSRKLSSEAGKGMNRAIQEGLESIQKALPSELTLSA